MKNFSLFAIAALLLHAQHSFCARKKSKSIEKKPLLISCVQTQLELAKKVQEILATNNIELIKRDIVEPDPRFSYLFIFELAIPSANISLPFTSQGPFYLSCSCPLDTITAEKLAKNLMTQQALTVQIFPKLPREYSSSRFLSKILGLKTSPQYESSDNDIVDSIDE